MALRQQPLPLPQLLPAGAKGFAVLDLGDHRHRDDHRPVVAALAAAALMVQGIDSSS
jgi:hypothetical protein